MSKDMEIFLIIFAILWGGGMLWAAILIISQLGKGTKLIKALKKSGYIEIIKRGDLTDEFKQFYLETEFGTTDVLNYMETKIKGKKIRFSIKTDNHKKIPLPLPGGREQIAYVQRVITLKNILMKQEEGITYYFVEENDRVTHLEYMNQRKTNSYQNAKFIAKIGEKQNSAEVNIRKKFKGPQGFLMGIAEKYTSIGEYKIKNLLPQFEDKFTVYKLSDENYLDENIQRLILKYENCFLNDMALKIQSKEITVSINTRPSNSSSYIECIERMIIEINKI